MATTGPYILHKSTQLCFAVRSNVNFEQIHPSVLSSKLAQKVIFNFPDGANTLPPRINFKVLSSAMNVFCEKVRLEREKFVTGKQQGKHRKRRHNHRHNELKCRPREGTNTNVEDLQKYEAKRSSDAVLLGAGGFFWTQERITDQDLINCTKNLKISDEESSTTQNHQEEATAVRWEVLTKQDNMSVLRRQMETGIYEYKVFGTFADVSARSFFTIQVDTEYRKVWDKYAAKLDIIDKDPQSGNEVLHWIMKYPYPLRTRDYVMIRRSKVDENEKKIVLISRATSHPKYPEGDEHVRVKEYASHMVIRPHRTFDENGMDFVLSSYDNPRMTIPAVCMNYASASGIPDYINTLHSAARKIQTPDDMFYCEKDQSLTALVKR